MDMKNFPVNEASVMSRKDSLFRPKFNRMMPVSMAHKLNLDSNGNAAAIEILPHPKIEKPTVAMKPEG